MFEINRRIQILENCQILFSDISYCSSRFLNLNFKGDLTTGEIVGIVIGSIGVLLIIVALITLLVCYVRKSKNEDINLSTSKLILINVYYKASFIKFYFYKIGTPRSNYNIRPNEQLTSNPAYRPNTNTIRPEQQPPQAKATTTKTSRK